MMSTPFVVDSYPRVLLEETARLAWRQSQLVLLQRRQASVGARTKLGLTDAKLALGIK
jgi:hypothetical protein